MKTLRTLVLTAAVALPGAVAAAPVDGQTNLICATLRSVECGPTGECLDGMAEDVNAPQFFRIDFEAGAVRAERPDGSTLDTSFAKPTREDGKLIFQGVENGRGWSAAITEDTGTIVVTASDEGVAFVVFGACTQLP